MSKMKMRDRNKPRREQRQREAQERQAVYDALTTEQKLAKLGDLPAKKQRAKLAKPVFKDVQVVVEGQALTVTAEVALDLTKEKKGAKARKQAKKDRKGRE